MSRHRDVSWILQKFRGMLLGRTWNSSQLRKKGDMSSRSPPHPLIPDGPAHRISDNYYLKRDTRRLVTPPKDYVNVLHEGKQIQGKVGQNLMRVAQAADIEIEASCEGSCACSTCHVYIDDKYFDKLPPAKDEEEDMLDVALFVKSNSRLSCQVILTNDLEGMEFKRPTATRNFHASKQGSDAKSEGSQKS